MCSEAKSRHSTSSAACTAKTFFTVTTCAHWHSTTVPMHVRMSPGALPTSGSLAAQLLLKRGPADVQSAQ